MKDTFDLATLPMVHLYSPHTYHWDQKIVGNRPGLLALRAAIDEALETGTACFENTPSDGEGGDLRVQLLDAGFDSPKWNRFPIEYLSHQKWKEG